jgi:hypothetical protein
MRWIPFLAALGLGLGCRAPKPSTNATPAACQGLTGASVPFDTARVRALVGTYDLALVDTFNVPRNRSVRVGRLKLWAQDSTRSLRGPFGRMRPGRGLERPIAGSFRTTPPDTSQWGRRFASEDLDRPGVIWTNHRLRMGDYDVLDGTGNDLLVREVYRDGFSGWWITDFGIAIVLDPKGGTYKPGGYFCARRVG